MRSLLRYTLSLIFTSFLTAGTDGNTVVTSGASLTTIVTSNPNNFTGGSGGLTQADHHYAVKIEMSRPGGKGNTTVVYGATGSADLYSAA